MNQSGELQMEYALTYKVEIGLKVQIEERLSVEALEALIINFDIKSIEGHNYLVASLERNEYQ